MLGLPKLFRRQEVVYMIVPITITIIWLSKWKHTSIKWDNQAYISSGFNFYCDSVVQRLTVKGPYLG